MKAIVVKELGAPEVMQLKEVEEPKIAPNQVLIQVQAISVNFADIKARQGQYHGTASGTAFTPGLDCAGEIIEVGSEVTKFKPGQRVMAFPKEGSYAEYAAADEDLTYMVPDELDIETAAASLTVGITAYNVIRKMARLTPGETILIHAAAGGIGLTAIQLAKIFGAGTVIGTVGSDEKKEVAKNFGAGHVINYVTEDFAAEVKKLTGGKGADVILDTVAGENFEKSMKCLAPFGRIISFGHGNTGSVPGNITTADLHSSCRSVIGYSTGTYRKQRPEFLQEAAEKITEFLLEKKLEMAISKRFPLAEASKAHAHIESRKSIGKILLVP
ncbi:quinone oxidoreductase family protein [Planococcus sp. 1R117A]|uniref:quinone oxidoreductase family protein n=1 Tax=Planococcus sp. 1R117A TaxID=3447020 RepID=UPI003EDB9E80